MIAHVASVLKDAFESQFPRKQAILDYVGFFFFGK